MAEPVFQRVRRILSGRIEDAVDRMERSGSDGVMREAVREVDRAIDEVKDDCAATTSRRLLAARQQKALREKAGEMTAKAKFAVAECRDDLAEAAISRQVEFETQAAKLDAVQSQASEEETRLSETLAALEARKREMEDALAAFRVSRGDAAMGAEPQNANRRDVERRVERAEQAFDRAIGGAGFERADAATVNRVAEIDVMQKRSIVAQRLAALKQNAGAA